MNFWKKIEEGIEHILRLDDPPHKVALAIALGIFVAFTPFLGLHLFIASFKNQDRGHSNFVLQSLDNSFHLRREFNFRKLPGWGWLIT